MAATIGGMGRRIGGTLVDFALPPRCPGCGTITEAIDLFCGDCWSGLRFLGPDEGCGRCGIPLAAGEVEACEDCRVLTNPPLDRVRAALAYGEVPRALAVRLKYARKIALARTMAGYMRRPLAALDPEAVLVPVPLHRWRLWRRGFNQSVLIARALGRPLEPDLLRRIKATPRLKGMDPGARRDTVKRAFAVRDGAAVKGRHFILVDDVLTTGATAEACARTLKRAGAARVELIAWARVLR